MNGEAETAATRPPAPTRAPKETQHPPPTERSPDQHLRLDELTTFKEANGSSAGRTSVRSRWPKLLSARQEQAMTITKDIEQEEMPELAAA